MVSGRAGAFLAFHRDLGRLCRVPFVVLAALGCSTVFPLGGSFDVSPPPLAGELEARVEGCHQVLLEWPNPVWPKFSGGSPGLMHYRISKEGTWTDFTDVTTATPVREWSDRRNYVVPMNPGEVAQFAVTAVDYDLNESPRLETTVAMPRATDPLCADVHPPKRPAVKANETGGATCGRTISFAAISSEHPFLEPQSGIDYYEVYRNGRFVSRFDGSYSQRFGQYPGSTYSYRVVAVDRAGNRSEPSDPLFLTLPEDCRKAGDASRAVRMLVLAVHPSDTPVPSVPVSEIYDFVRGGPTWPEHSLADYFAEVSYGYVELDVHTRSDEWVRLPSPFDANDPGGYCPNVDAFGSSIRCDYDRVFGDALAEVGVSEEEFDRFLLITSPNMNRNVRGGNRSFVKLADVQRTYMVALHEVAHGLSGNLEHSGGRILCPREGVDAGFEHAAGLRDDDPLFGCNRIGPKGDTHSPLGASGVTHHLPMVNKWFMGFLEPSNTAEAPSRTVQFTLFSAESQEDRSALRHVVVPTRFCARAGEDTSYFSLEYRTRTGFDADPFGVAVLDRAPVDGVQIRFLHRQGAMLGAHESVFIGTLEASGVRRFESRHARIEIELLSRDGEKAEVRVKRPFCARPGGQNVNPIS